MLKQYEAAVIAGRQAVSHAPNHHVPYLVLAAALAQSDQIDEARKQAREILRLNPSFSLRRHAERSPFKNKADLDHRLDGLRKAGLPE